MDSLPLSAIAGGGETKGLSCASKVLRLGKLSSSVGKQVIKFFLKKKKKRERMEDQYQSSRNIFFTMNLYVLLKVLQSTRKIETSYAAPIVMHATPRGYSNGEAPTERGTIFRLKVYERVGILPLKDTTGQENLSFGSVKGPKRDNR